METSKKSIENESDYKKAMDRIEFLMNKGSENVTQVELNEIKELALMAQNYETQTMLI